MKIVNFYSILYQFNKFILLQALTTNFKSMSKLASDNTQSDLNYINPNLKHLRIWLSIIYILVLAIVVVGGATRLTDSGLSITEWQPIHGMIPPVNTNEWYKEFEKYQQIPQYKEINKGMTLEEFKYIYWWEWGHRFLGRIIGLAFVVPFAFFLFKGWIEKRWIPHLIVLLFLGSLQGFIGWWMVKSGLANRTDVSQYRLALHLTTASVILGYIVFLFHRMSANYQYQTQQLPLKLLSVLFAILLFVQIILGAFAAGLSAGLTFNSWPLIDGKWIPDGLFILNPVWKNFFENILTVQYQHRVVAYLLVVLALCQFVISLKTNERQMIGNSAIILGLSLLQSAIGILTLVLVVPITLALVHQFLAIIILSFSVWHMLTFPNQKHKLLQPN